MELTKTEGFEWDLGNQSKNNLSHGVTWDEAEEVFKIVPLLMFADDKHSKSEIREGVYGKTSKGRLLVVIYTIRHNKIRIISARDQNKREKMFYKKYEK
ncbi:BrnT family toxin [Candidatus Shapirobacteria bacterium]|nr:BrnT family toxin [Candidatus Shapirobacteria bacterium]